LYLDRSGNLSGVLLGIPEGAKGVRATLRLMAALARRYRSDLKIRETAADLVQHLPQKAWGAQIRALHAFVRDGIRYLKDPNGVELVQTPLVTLEVRHGDCDDKSVLLATLLESIDHPARYVAVGFEPGRFSHVYVETKLGARWHALETTADMPAGFAPLRAVTRMIETI